MNELLHVEDLRVTFSLQGKTVEAVRGISFSIMPGEVVGIVGESGSGKSVAVQSLLGLTDGKVSGKIDHFCQKIAMIFQDPLTALNPTMKIGHQILEGMPKKDLLRVHELLQLVELPERTFHQYPHQLSGGMRQRALIAVALSLNPSLLIADEPTTALDTIMTAQILSLLKTLQKKCNMALLLITHDFGLVAEICDRVLVFHQGKIVEEGIIEEILLRPQHPYTQLLLNAIARVPHA